MAVLRHIDEQATQRNRLHHIDYLVLHRLSLAYYHPKDNPEPVPDNELAPADVERFFRRLTLTGRKVPYHVIVSHFAEIWQMLPLLAKGNHTGYKYNRRSVAVALIGNTDERPMTPGQYERLIEVCADLVMLRPGGLEMIGHTDLNPSKKWPDKRCPGRFVNMSATEIQTAWSLPEDWENWTQEQCFNRIEESGYLIDVSKSGPAIA